MNELLIKLEKLKNISGQNDKKKFIKNNQEDKLFLDTLEFLLNPYKITNISKKKINKKVQIMNNKLKDLNEFYDYLANKSSGRDKDIAIIQAFIREHEEFREELEGLACKSMRLGVQGKLVNQALGYNLIPTFEIMLGSKADLNKLPKGDKFVTEKYDGCRCFTQIRKGKIIMKSRQDKLFEGLVDIENSIKELGLNDLCIDGELLAIDSNYENVYKDTMKIVSTKEKEKHGVKYMIFDILPIDEFDNKKGVLKYSQRRKILDNIKQNEFINITPILYHGNDNDKVLDVLSECRGNGAEGCMINLDKPYEFKRSKTLLKLKVMNSCDLKIIGFEEGEGKYKGVLGNLICDYKGYQVGVGSGFDDKQREQIWNNQEKYLNRIAEIQYFEETYNDKGGLSLRFPVFKCVRELGKEVSYD